MAKKKGIDAEIDKVLRIMEANPDTPADVAANLLNQARISGDGPLRQKYLRKAQKVIAEIDPHEDPEKLQELQAQVLALQGRGGDTEIAHLTPGELVIPKRMRTPELMAALARAARQASIDPARLVVGDRRNSVNPRTGQAEFADMGGPIGSPQDSMETVTVIGRRLPPLTPGDVNLLGRMIYTEGAGQYRVPGLFQALGSAALNRQGVAPDTTSISDILSRKGQFQGVNKMTTGDGRPSLWAQSANPENLTGSAQASYQEAQRVAQGLADGSLSDNTNGATHFGSGPGNGVIPSEMQSWLDKGLFERSREDLGNWAFLKQLPKPPKPRP